MTHLWVRAEQRDNEERVGITPEGAATLIQSGISITIEESPTRCIPSQKYRDVGCVVAPEHSWPSAPLDAIIFGLKELPGDGTALIHNHIMFGHAFKGQVDGKKLLKRFQSGKGTLYDLEYLVDPTGRRVAAFGYWAGYVGAAIALKCWTAQQRGEIAGSVATYRDSETLITELKNEFNSISNPLPKALIIGALGRVGSGARDLCKKTDVQTTDWDMAETASGGPFPEVLEHDIFFNCILARPGAPVFVPKTAITAARQLTVIGDIACDPDSAFSPIKIYNQPTTWSEPALRVASEPPLDVTAIDNLPSLLPAESSVDFAEQLLPSLLKLTDLQSGVWGEANKTFQHHLSSV